jgi:benzil reductase ((S)-benzoin forming)
MEKLLVVTGSSRGLGKEILDEFANQYDYSLQLVRLISEDSILEKTQFLSTQDLNTVISVIMNFSSRFNEVLLINNAGVLGEVGLIGDLDLDEFNEMVSTNCYLPVFLVNALLKYMKLDKLDVINISSGVSIKPVPGWINYSCSKAFLNAMSMCINVDSMNIYETRIRSTSINPGPLNTGMQKIIRDYSEHKFPKADHFKTLHSEGILKDPKLVAMQIKEYYNSGYLFEHEFIDFNLL